MQTSHQRVHVRCADRARMAGKQQAVIDSPGMQEILYTATVAKQTENLLHLIPFLRICFSWVCNTVTKKVFSPVNET